jgi:hypothetical protein
MSQYTKVWCYQQVTVGKENMCHKCLTDSPSPPPFFLTVLLLLSLKTITIIKDLCCIIILNTQYWNKLGHLSQIIAADWNEHSLIPRSRSTRSIPFPLFLSQILFGKISNKWYATARVVINIYKTIHLLL